MVGSLAFFVMVIVTMTVMAGLPRIYGTLGLVILLGHYVDGLFDIFWIGALSITPFIVAGISLGMADADPGAEHVPDLLAAAAGPTGRRRDRGGAVGAGAPEIVRTDRTSQPVVSGPIPPGHGA